MLNWRHQEHQLILKECYEAAKNIYPVIDVDSSDGLMQMIQHAKNNTTSRIHQRVQGKEDKEDKKDIEDKDQTLVLILLLLWLLLFRF